MPVYSYKGIDEGASAVTGTIMAETPRQARDELRSRGVNIQVLEVAKGSGGGRPKLFASRHGLQVIEFARELSTLLGVGVPLLGAIDTTIASRKPGAFRTCLMSLREEVSAGVALAQALKKQPAHFDEFFVSTVEVGERAGTLERCLDQVATFQEQARQVRGRIGTALLYPGLVLVMGIGVAVLLMTFVVPSLLEPLLQSGRPLPSSTRIVKAGSDFLLRSWWALLGSMGLAAAGFRAALRTEGGRRLWDRSLLRIPLLGGLLRKNGIVQVATSMSLLLRTGVPFDRALRVAAKTMRNRVLQDALAKCETAVLAGQDIGRALENTGAFSPTVVQVFRMGQESGRMDEMLGRLATDYDKQVQTAAQRFVAVLEPILIVLLAALVGFVAFATVMPILEAGDVL